MPSSSAFVESIVRTSSCATSLSMLAAAVGGAAAPHAYQSADVSPQTARLSAVTVAAVPAMRLTIRVLPVGIYSVESPALRDPNAHQFRRSIEFETNRTLPSAINTCAPPGW